MRPSNMNADYQALAPGFSQRAVANAGSAVDNPPSGIRSADQMKIDAPDVSALAKAVCPGVFEAA